MQSAWEAGSGCAHVMSDTRGPEDSASCSMRVSLLSLYLHPYKYQQINWSRARARTHGTKACSPRPSALMTLPRATSDRCTKMSCSSVTCHNVSNKASAERGRGQCLFLPLLLVAAGGGNFLAAAEAAAIKGAHFVLLRAALVALRHNNAEDGVRARGAGGICLAHEALQQMDAVVGRLDVLLRNIFHHSAPVGALHQVQFTCNAKITT